VTLRFTEQEYAEFSKLKIESHGTAT